MKTMTVNVQISMNQIALDTQEIFEYLSDVIKRVVTFIVGLFWSAKLLIRDV